MSTPDDADEARRRAFVIRPAQARPYGMGRMRAIFLADGPETASRYSVYEWWLEPRTRGPGVHENPEDHIFCVIAGTLSVCLEGEWTDAPCGSYAAIPGGIPHDFENRGAEPCGFIGINVPGGFEEDLPDVVKWFAEHPPEQIPRS